MHSLRHFGFCALAVLSVTPTSAQQTDTSQPRTTRPVRAEMPRVLPGTRESAFVLIKGNAFDADDKALPSAVVRLRDASFGRIVEKQITDDTGLFAFRSVNPGPYVVELMGTDERPLAASQLLIVGPGDAVSTIVKLPIDTSPPGSVFGHADPHARNVTTAAGNAGVLATGKVGVDASAR